MFQCGIILHHTYVNQNGLQSSPLLSIHDKFLTGYDYISVCLYSAVYTIFYLINIGSIKKTNLSVAMTTYAYVYLLQSTQYFTG